MPRPTGNVKVRSPWSRFVVPRLTNRSWGSRLVGLSCPVPNSMPKISDKWRNDHYNTFEKGVDMWCIFGVKGHAFRRIEQKECYVVCGASWVRLSKGNSLWLNGASKVLLEEPEIALQSFASGLS